MKQFIKHSFLGLMIVAATGFAAYTSVRATSDGGDDDKKTCHIKIMKMVDGVITETNSAIECCGDFKCKGDKCTKCDGKGCKGEGAKCTKHEGACCKKGEGAKCMKDMKCCKKMMLNGEEKTCHGKMMKVFVDENGEEQCKVMMMDVDDKDRQMIGEENNELMEKQDLRLDDLSFSPNPSNGRFNLSFVSPDKNPVEITVLDIQGKKVYKEQVSDFSGTYNKEIEIAKDGKGVYFLQINQGEKALTRKIMIQ